MKELGFYFKSLRLHLLGGVEYHGWWIMVLQVLVTVVLDPLGTALMFVRFGSVGPWSIERILLVYTMAVTSYGMAESFFRGFDYFPSKMVRSGDFDRLLLRPKSLFTQSAISYFHIHRLARPAAGIAVGIWCLSRLNVPLTAANALLFVSATAGGTLLYAGVFVLMAGISFFTIGVLDWMIIFTNASYQITRIPHDYMPRLLKNAFTFVMPMLVISYYPASVLCGWGEPLWKGCLALPAGAAFLGGSLLVWRVGVRHYKSTGS